MKKLAIAFSFVVASLTTFATGHTVSIISNTNITCNGLCDGSASASVSGGVGPFTFAWSPSGGTAATATNLCAGSYTVTATDNSDMSTATAIVVISQPPVLTVSMGSTNTVCGPGSCVVLSPTVMGGTAGYTFTWSPGTDLSSPIIYNPTSCPATTTTYTFTVTDMNGCTANASTIVYVPTPLTTSITSTNVTSCGACDGAATIMPSGGTSPYAYYWNPGITTQTASGLCPGSYTVTVTSANGCTTDDTVEITEPAVHVNFTMVPDSANVNTFWAFNTSSGNISYYAWDFGDGGASTLASPTYTYGSAGPMTVCLYIGNGGCGDTLCDNINVSGVLDPCMALFHIAPDTLTANLNDYTVYNLSYGSPLTYLWDFGDGATSTLANPTHVYSTSTGPYLICLTVDNGSGCTHTFCDSIFSVDSLSRATDPISFTVVDVAAPLITGVKEAVLTNGISVYPNPFTDNTTFIINDKGNSTFTFEMTDVLGKKVKEMNEITANKFEISRSGLQNGIYFYKIYSAGKLVNVGKLVIK